MSNTDKRTERLAELIESGTATERELGTANKAIQLMLASQLSNGAARLYGQMEKLNELAEMGVDTIRHRMENGKVENWETENLIEFITKVKGQYIQTLELLRKITQGRTAVFNETLLSTDEKNVVNLFKTFKTEAQKREFLKVVQERMSIIDTKQDITDIDAESESK